MREVHKTYMAELEIEILREKNKKLKQEINQLKDLLDKHLNIKTTRMDKEQQKQYAIEIAEKVCNYYQIKYGQMMSKYRGEEVTLARAGAGGWRKLVPPPSTPPASPTQNSQR